MAESGMLLGGDCWACAKEVMHACVDAKVVVIADGQVTQFKEKSDRQRTCAWLTWQPLRYSWVHKDSKRGPVPTYVTPWPPCLQKWPSPGMRAVCARMAEAHACSYRGLLKKAFARTRGKPMPEIWLHLPHGSPNMQAFWGCGASSCGNGHWLWRLSFKLVNAHWLWEHMQMASWASNSSLSVRATGEMYWNHKLGAFDFPHNFHGAGLRSMCRWALWVLGHTRLCEWCHTSSGTWMLDLGGCLIDIPSTCL